MLSRVGHTGQTGAVIGAVVIVLILVVIVPIGVFVGGIVGASVLGWALNRDATETYEGTEYLELGN